MYRSVEKELLEWKNRKEHTPLIIRGARQVGKSFVVQNLGKQHFKHFLEVNFEEIPEAKACFESLEINQILKKLKLLFSIPVIEGETLVFLDEIQNCPQALKALRYFKEKLPNLHVIAAGSLLEFVLDEEPLSFPVGRVRFLNMRPFSFLEFLQATGKGQWVEVIENVAIDQPLEEEFHQLLLTFVKDYFLTGGMPEAIRSFSQEKDYHEVQIVQHSLLDLYRLDLAKYSKKRDFPNLQKLFERSPHFVAKHFRYSKIDPEAPNPARSYKRAIVKLNQAGILSSVHATAANGIPLKAEENEKKFKLLFLDVGLLQRALWVEPKEYLSDELMHLHTGVLAEQFVGQELLAYTDPYLEKNLYFWEREKAGAAEIDYVMNIGGKVVPVEVKAGETGRLKSMQYFLENKPAAVGMHVSTKPLNIKKNVIQLPLYMISQIERLLNCPARNQAGK